MELLRIVLKSLAVALSTASAVMLGMLALAAGAALAVVLLSVTAVASLCAAAAALNGEVVPGQVELALLGGVIFGWGTYQLMAEAGMLLPC